MSPHRSSLAMLFAFLFLLVGCASNGAKESAPPPSPSDGALVAPLEEITKPDPTAPVADADPATPVSDGASASLPNGSTENGPIPMATDFVAARDRIGTLRIDDFGLVAALYDGAHAAALEEGVGHLRGSGEIGQPGNVVIAGWYEREFRMLPDMKEGQRIVIEQDDQTNTYEMIERGTTGPRDLDWIEKYADGQYVSLVTNPSDDERLYVVCELINPN